MLAAQAARAFAYGFGAVLLGTTLHRRHLSGTEVGIVLAAIVAGGALMSIVLARSGDRIGRRRCYTALYFLLALTGVTFALTDRVWVLVLVALAGAFSTDVVDSGPFTSLEQAMLATEVSGRDRIRVFSIYNAVAGAGGALGALAAGLPSLVRSVWADAPGDSTWFLIVVPVAAVGLLLGRSLSASVEVAPSSHTDSTGLARSRPIVIRLAGLFALDSFGGGFVVQAFVAYWLVTRFGASTETVAFVFFGVAMSQTISFLAAWKVAQRIGLLSTMVWTHLASNALLILIAVAPSLELAVAALVGRTLLSQMDVPARQAYVMTLVDPSERTAAAAYTSTARYLSRPVGPALAGAASSVALGLPFVIAGVSKAIYDVVLWRWFSRVPLPDDQLS
ncbi:MAG: MFS transporter [Acidimicrobiia bacterium]